MVPTRSPYSPDQSTAAPPRWYRLVLLCAMLHSGVWGLFIMGFPSLSAKVYGFADTPADVHLWQGAGLFIFLLAVGYAIAARNPIQHWSVVLLGLLAKIFGVIGMCTAVYEGRVSPNVLWLLPLNDIAWWIPFAIIVRAGISAERRNQVQTRL